MKLRPYQKEAVDALFAYFETKEGNPLVVLPTGTGKSLTQAAFIKRACELYPGTNFLLLTHVKELIQQDARAIIQHWPEAPIGIWSASVGRKDHAQITVAGIQSIHKYPAKFGGTDLVLIDEAHLVSKNANTMYGRFLAGLREHNEHLKVIGSTATHYRLDSGLLIEGDGRLFTDIAYEYDVGDAIKQGYLCPLVSKNGVAKADLSGVHTRGGEFRADELAAANDHAHLIEGSLDEIAQYAHDRKHVLVFSAGIEHGAHIVDAMRRRGWTADLVHGEMGGRVRDAKLVAFTSGRVRYLVNAMLLTTGFDFPGIDCIVDYQSTKSVGLHVQKLGRGLRNVLVPGHDLDTQEGRLAAIAGGPKPNCLILDFAGNVERHGPIDMIRVKSKRAKGEDAISIAPVKECPECHELVHASVMVCPACEYEFPAKPAHSDRAGDGVVVAAIEPPRVLLVDSVQYAPHDKVGKPRSMRVIYSVGLQIYNEWVPLEDERSTVRKHAVRWFWQRGMTCPETVDEALELAKAGRIPQPSTITVKIDGKWWKVIDADLSDQLSE
ncbi:DEAD/DEAH box helicase [Burkholderia sp. Bp8990]|uniref:DEAD/DEAH box helicase n=1 Tax=Burkholderia sp. Bp8990 TaxID=2184552 RepID=UPI000F5A7967|nr:DEAD/DEAH box helicase [Burkholderia sp. Bp8990]RQS39791.1 DNA helicase [Burkholderia sp. Bp8990]